MISISTNDYLFCFEEILEKDSDCILKQIENIANYANQIENWHEIEEYESRKPSVECRLSSVY